MVDRFCFLRKCTVLLLLYGFDWNALNDFIIIVFFSVPPPTQLRNEVLPLQLRGVQHLDNGSLRLNPDTLSHQRLKQKLLVSCLCEREIKACWCWTGCMVHYSWRPLRRHLLSAIVRLSCSSLCFGLWTCEPWVIFSSSCWFNFEMSCARCCLVHLESSLGLIGVKVAVFSVFHDRWPCQGEVRRQCLLT